MTSLQHMHAAVKVATTSFAAAAEEKCPSETLKICVGEHARTWTVFGMTINADTVWGSILVAVIVCGLAYFATRKATSGVPGKGQLLYELIVEQVQGITDSAIGPKGRKYVPIGITLFMFILLCNWISLFPSGHNPEWLPSPTSDINLPLAMAALVIISVHVTSIKTRGIGGYLKHYAQPSILMLPINIIEELTKPITLTFRLFGNVFAGGLMISVMTALLPIWAFPPFEFGWKLFDMFIGAIQAFIFALLTIIYFGMALDNPEH